MGLYAHVLSIESGFIEGGYTPHCDCGWVGLLADTSEEAIEEWGDHCDAVFMEATNPEGVG